MAQGQGGRSRINLEEFVGLSDGPGVGNGELGARWGRKGDSSRRHGSRKRLYLRHGVEQRALVTPGFQIPESARIFMDPGRNEPVLVRHLLCSDILPTSPHSRSEGSTDEEVTSPRPWCLAMNTCDLSPQPGLLSLPALLILGRGALV